MLSAYSSLEGLYIAWMPQLPGPGNIPAAALQTACPATSGTAALPLQLSGAKLPLPTMPKITVPAACDGDIVAVNKGPGGGFAFEIVLRLAPPIRSLVALPATYKVTAGEVLPAISGSPLYAAQIV